VDATAWVAAARADRSETRLVIGGLRDGTLAAARRATLD